MRIAVVFFPVRKRNQLVNLSKALIRGMESQGHKVDLIDGEKEIGKKLTPYQYIAVGVEASDMFGKIPEKVPQFLAQAGTIIGKPGLAFITKALFGAQKSLMKVMKSMEHEGMLVVFSDVFENDIHAEGIGKRLHISEKNS